jgi:PAS domain S-box-containing protein
MDDSASAGQVPSWGAADPAELLRALLDESPDGVLVSDRAGAVVAANARAAALAGRPVDLVGVSLLDLLASPEPGIAQPRLEELCRPGEQGTVRALKRDGGEIAHVEVSCRALSGDRLLWVLRDGSERRRRELDLWARSEAGDATARTRPAEALRESEERLGQAVRVAELGIFDNDLRHRLVHWSARMREIFDMGPGEVVTMAKMLERVHPEDRAVVQAAIARAEEPASDGRYDVDCRLLHRDGAVRFVSVRALTFFEGEGVARRAVRRVGACRDVTEATLASAERERLRTQLEHAQRLDSVGRLAGGVAHDFNNMLAVILGTAEVMRARPDLAPDLDADLAEIERAAQHARDVTRQLLAFSRKQVVSPRVLDLNEVVERARKTLSRLIGEDVAFSLHLSPGLWRVSLDALQVDQVLMNLAVNARDAMLGGGRLTLETANVQLDEAYCRQHPGFRPGDHVLLSVSDSGVGMDRETARHVFEPFFTTKGPGKGTGLGLATVYGIVTQAGGSIHVYSEPGHGSTFKIYFPRHRGAGDEAREVEQLPAVPGGGTVLLVEDDGMVRRMVGSMLSSLGLTVLPAGGPAEALAIVGRGGRDVDLVLTDVVMPEMNGKALRDRLHGLRPGLPVLFMSGYTPNVIVHHGVLDEGVRLLQKPFTLTELAAALRDAMRAARAARGGS